jgi:hypothetical protein
MKSKIVGPGSYYIYFFTFQNEIILNEITDEEMIFGENWATIHYSGYFEGSSLKDIRFVGKELETSNEMQGPKVKVPKGKKYVIQTIYNEPYVHFENESLSGHYTLMTFLNYKDSIKINYNLSQEEIDAIVKELKDGYETPVTISVPGFNQTSSPQKMEDPKCMFHEWVEYTGLIEKFFHCKKCGEKRK